jgi:hypothetical protein
VITAEILLLIFISDTSLYPLPVRFHLSHPCGV